MAVSPTVRKTNTVIGFTEEAYWRTKTVDSMDVMEGEIAWQTAGGESDYVGSIT